MIKSSSAESALGLTPYLGMRASSTVAAVVATLGLMTDRMAGSEVVALSARAQDLMKVWRE